MSEDPLQIVMQSHHLPELYAKIEAHLSEERSRRERFYAEIPKRQKAEFIDGEVIVQQEFGERHLAAAKNLVSLLRWPAVQRGGQLLHESTLCVFPRNDYQPDLIYFGHEKAATFAPNVFKYPIPDFVVEILTDSTEAIDRGIKFIDYEYYGVQEYWIVDPREKMLEQYVLGGSGKYNLLVKSHCGEVECRVINGLAVSIESFL